MMGKIHFPSIFRCDALSPKEALKKAIEEIEDSGVEIDEDELEQRIEDVCKTYGISLPKRRVKPKEKSHTCTQCGAPLKNGKCEYCGTDFAN